MIQTVNTDKILHEHRLICVKFQGIHHFIGFMVPPIKRQQTLTTLLTKILSLTVPKMTLTVLIET